MNNDDLLSLILPEDYWSADYHCITCKYGPFVTWTMTTFSWILPENGWSLHEISSFDLAFRLGVEIPTVYFILFWVYFFYWRSLRNLFIRKPSGIRYGASIRPISQQILQYIESWKKYFKRGWWNIYKQFAVPPICIWQLLRPKLVFFTWHCSFKPRIRQFAKKTLSVPCVQVHVSYINISNILPPDIRIDHGAWI